MSDSWKKHSGRDKEHRRVWVPWVRGDGIVVQKSGAVYEVDERGTMVRLRVSDLAARGLVEKEGKG